MNINYDYFGLAEPARFYLCKTDNTIVCELNGIDLQSVSYTKQLNNFDSIQFDVHRYVNGEKSNGYDMIDEAMYIFVDGIGYFRISYPEVSNDGFDEYKSVTAQSCECELALKILKNFKINTGETDSYEYLVDGNTRETDEGVKIAVENITLYNQKNPNLSLLDIALGKVSGWKIGKVDQTVAITTIEENTINEDGSVTTKKITSASKRTFDIDSKSVYAFFTQDVSKKFECIFDFDIMNRIINVYDVKTYGKDSNVFISYRNLIQELRYSPAQENNILTRFDVRGADDLAIDAVNFGTSTIEDLSYYLSTKHHVNDDLVDHYNKWLRAVEDARKKYMAFNRQYNILMEKRDEVNNRVPNDGLNNNWKQFTIEELNTIKEKYSGYMTALKDKQLGYWDENNKKWLNKGAEQDYIAYQGILEIIDQTIKYKQASVGNTQKEEDTLDDLIEEWNSNWDLFGLAELKTKEKTYLQNIETLDKYSVEWEKLSDTQKTETHLSKENYNNSRDKYLKYMKYEYGYDSNGNPYSAYQENPYKPGCCNAIKERQAEYDSLQKQMDIQSDGMRKTSSSVNKELYMSDKEIVTLNKLYNDTDYTNENILITSIDTADKIINTQYELLKDAQTELSKVCQPQLSFTLTMDNIFSIPGFKEWQGNFDIGNYAHLSFDQNEQYFLKLRISSLTFNPCIIENDFQIEFTNMISYNGGRDDFAALLDESVNASKSQITGSVKKKLDTSGIEVSDLLIKAMINSNVFNNTIANGVYDTISANTGIFNNLIAKTINVQQLMANSGLFETIDAGDGNIRSVLAVEVNASRMSVGTLVTDRLILRGKNSIMYELNNFGDITETKIPDGDLDKYYLNGKHLQLNTLSADRIISHSINSEQITTDNIRGTNGWINLANGTFLFFNGISNGTGKQTDSYLKPINEKEWSAAASGISWDGKQLSIKGNVVATSLTLGSNVSIKTDNISGLEKYATVKSLGDYAKTSDVTNDISAAEGRMQDYSQNSVKNYTNSDDFKKFYLHVDGSVGTQAKDDHGEYASGFFNVSKDGLLVAENAVIYGKLFSSEGLIAGWNITNDALSKNLGYNKANSADKHNAYFGTSGLSISDKFVVDNNGNFTFGGKNGISYNGSKISLGSDVSITWGQVTGTGNIATTSQIPTKVSDLDNDANYKSGKQVEEAITNKGYQTKTEVENAITSKGYKTESEIQTIINGKGFYTSTDVVNYIKSDEFKEITNPQVTKITKDTIESATISANQINGGTITGVAINGVNFTGCKGDFTGEVVASKLTANIAGSIAGWTITSDALYKNLGYNQENTNDKHNAYFGKDGLSISNTFVVSADGSLTATKGRISGWNLTQGGLWYNDATDYRVYLLNGTDDSKNVIVIGDKTKNITDPNYYTFWLHANGNMSANRVNVQENLYVNQYFYYSKDAYSQTSTGAVNTRLCDLNENGNSRLARVSSSSKRYKTILSNISNKDIEKMFDIPTYWFKYKPDYIMKTDERYEKAIPGFIVEDWENIMPIAIDHIDGKPEMWNNNIVVPLMFEMLKTVKKENNDLKQRIKTLESKLA